MATKTATDELRKSPTMTHLLDAAESGQDIGHYGRLTLAMVGAKFMEQDDLVKILLKSGGADETEVKAMVQQVVERGYNPPSRARLQEWSAEQDFPLMPNPDDPDSGNLYRELTMPDEVIESIEEYREQKLEASEA